MAVARVSEIIASSPESFKEATQNGLERAAQTLRGITGMEVTRMQVKVENNKILEYRVHLNVIFVLE